MLAVDIVAPADDWTVSVTTLPAAASASSGSFSTKLRRTSVPQLSRLIRPNGHRSHSINTSGSVTIIGLDSSPRTKSASTPE